MNKNSGLIIKNSCVYFVLLVLASFSFLMPAFEGYDENAHYSRILDARQDVSTQFLGEGKLNQSIVSFPGPVAYSSGSPPFSGPRTYDVFFAHSSKEALLNLKLYPATGPTYQLSEERNWQYQHPPLYYLVSSVLGGFCDFDSLIDSVIYYRLVSVLFTVLGIFITQIGMRALAEQGIVTSVNAERSVWVLALCFPMFYFEFARIGNDSLAFLFLSCTFLYATKVINARNPRVNLFLLGISLMLCLWTKALVIPMVPVFAIYAWHCLKLDKTIINTHDFLLKYSLIFVLPVFLGFCWYIYSYLHFGHLGIGIEARDLQAAGGLLAGLKVNFDLYNFLRGILVPFATFTYAGSWSLIRPDILLYILLGVLYSRLLVLYFKSLVLRPAAQISIQPIILISVMYLGMIHHVLVSMALTGLGTTPGWYLYVLTAWIILAMGIALKKIGIIEWVVMCVIGSISIAYAYISSALIYSGYISKADNKSMLFLGEYSDIMTLPIMERLSHVSYPNISIAFLFAAMILGILTIIKKGW